MEWKRYEAKYVCGELLLLGAWNVGGIHYDSCRTRDDPLKYAATCKLPGIKAILGHYKTDAEAKTAAEKAVAHWLSKLPPNVQIEARPAFGASLSNAGLGILTEVKK